MSESMDEPEFSLVQLRNGSWSVRMREFAETMHPGIGPAAEAEALYVRQTGFVERLARLGSAEPFVVWDVGLGAAANVVSILEAARKIPCRMQILSFDNTAAPLLFALENRTKLPYLAAWEAPLRELLQHRIARLNPDADSQIQGEWKFFVDDFPQLLRGPAASHWAKPHLILYDPFSPARNPAMWTLDVFTRLFRLLDPARVCLVPTYSRSTLLRVTLLLAGFYVGSGQATGRKEETTLASNRLDMLVAPLSLRWLERARRSDSAEPLVEETLSSGTRANYRRGPLSEESWQRLQSHPQFNLAAR